MRLKTLGLVLIGALVSASAHAETPPTELKIGVPSQVGSTGKPELGTATEYIDRFVTKDFAGSPTKITWVPVPGAGPGINEALASGQVDFGYYGDFPSIIGKAGNLDIKLILGGKRGMNSYLLVPFDSTAKSIADLKGKRVAINKGRPWNFAFSRLLKESGLKESDFQMLNLSPGDGAAALISGNIDALYQPAPFAQAMEEKKQARIIWATRDLPLGWRFTLDLFATSKFADQYPETTQKLVNSFVKAAQYASLPENRDEMLRSMVTAGATFEMQAKENEGVPFREQIVPLVDDFTRGHYQQVMDFMKENKMIRKEFAMNEFIDDRFIKSALKTLKLEDYWTAADSEGRPVKKTATK